MKDDLIIDAKNLKKSFGSKIAVNNISIKVKKGDVFGFLGPNGAGKTTTIRMICGLLNPDSAEGTCLGFDILRESHRIKFHVGYMTQRFSLYNDLTIAENLDFVARLYLVKNRKESVQRSLEELGLQDRQKQLAGALSGGWKQRLALSAALIHNPKLLLLDEPTAGVDPQARREFWTHIQSLAAKGVTVLVSTHYMDEAERCSSLAYIFNGKIMIEGTAEEIIEKSSLNTWIISGKGNLSELSELLYNDAEIDQVARFGNKLHICSNSVEYVNKLISSTKKDGWKWKKEDPDLEDIFINLCNKNR